jgi:hypothetical protein
MFERVHGGIGLVVGARSRIWAPGNPSLLHARMHTVRHQVLPDTVTALADVASVLDGPATFASIAAAAGAVLFGVNQKAQVCRSGRPAHQPSLPYTKHHPVDCAAGAADAGTPGNAVRGPPPAKHRQPRGACSPRPRASSPAPPLARGPCQTALPRAPQSP